MDYSLCDQTVTLYRKNPEGILRLELFDCFFLWKDGVSYDRLGKQQERKFLLIQPGEEQLVFPGDRVFAGIGPEIALEDWNTFIPQAVDGLAQVAYAAPYYWQGQFCHTEAGRK